MATLFDPLGINGVTRNLVSKGFIYLPDGLKHLVSP